MAPIKCFLKIDLLEGDSTTKGFQKQIQLESCSWGLSESIVVSGSGGSSGVNPVRQPFQFTAKVNASSPKLMLACATGQHFTSAVLSVLRPGPGSGVFLKYTLSDLLVSSYQMVTNATSGAVLDSVSLHCTKVQIEYHRSNPAPALAVTAGYDFVTNKKI